MSAEDIQECETTAGASPTPKVAVGGAAISSTLLRITRLHHALANQMLRRIGLHPSQELVMMRLWEEGPQRQADLAAAIGTDTATMTRTIQRLEQGGFVRRTPSPTDKRSSIIEATTASQSIRAGVEEVWETLENGVLADLDEQEQSVALGFLTRMEVGLAKAYETNSAL